MRSGAAVKLVSTALGKTVRQAVGNATGLDAAVRLVTGLIGKKDREHLVVVHLSAQHRPAGIEIVAIGDLSTAVVHPREVFKAAILANAAAIVVGHNHPSGELAPSDDDIAMMRNLRLAGVILGIPVIDSIIVFRDECRSVSAIA